MKAASMVALTAGLMVASMAVKTVVMTVEWMAVSMVDLLDS
jgi:hypothetical protein